MKKTLKIEEEVHTELTKVVGHVTAQEGKQATYEDAIMFLINEWKKRK